MKGNKILLIVALILAILAAIPLPAYGFSLLAASLACYLGSLLADG